MDSRYCGVLLAVLLWAPGDGAAQVPRDEATYQAKQAEIRRVDAQIEAFDSSPAAAMDAAQEAAAAANEAIRAAELAACRTPVECRRARDDDRAREARAAQSKRSGETRRDRAALQARRDAAVAAANDSAPLPQDAVVARLMQGATYAGDMGTGKAPVRLRFLAGQRYVIELGELGGNKAYLEGQWVRNGAFIALGAQKGGAYLRGVLWQPWDALLRGLMTAMHEDERQEAAYARCPWLLPSVEEAANAAEAAAEKAVQSVEKQTYIPAASPADLQRLIAELPRITAQDDAAALFAKLEPWAWLSFIREGDDEVSIGVRSLRDAYAVRVNDARVRFATIQATEYAAVAAALAQAEQQTEGASRAQGTANAASAQAAAQAAWRHYQQRADRLRQLQGLLGMDAAPTLAVTYPQACLPTVGKDLPSAADMQHPRCLIALASEAEDPAALSSARVTVVTATGERLQARRSDELFIVEAIGNPMLASIDVEAGDSKDSGRYPVAMPCHGLHMLVNAPAADTSLRMVYRIRGDSLIEHRNGRDGTLILTWEAAQR